VIETREHETSGYRWTVVHTDADTPQRIAVALIPETQLTGLLDRLARAYALHQPTVITDWQPCEAHLTASRPRVNHCPNCVLQPITVCAQTTCEGWPCPTAKALDGEEDNR
jgi:hypothetical protein